MKGLSEESLEREKMRERGTARVRVRETDSEQDGKGGKRDREGSRGDWSPGNDWIVETGGQRGSSLGGG